MVLNSLFLLFQDVFPVDNLFVFLLLKRKIARIVEASLERNQNETGFGENLNGIENLGLENEGKSNSACGLLGINCGVEVSNKSRGQINGSISDAHSGSEPVQRGFAVN